MLSGVQCARSSLAVLEDAMNCDANDPAAKRYARIVDLPYLPLLVPAGAATAWQTGVFDASQDFVVELPTGRLDSVAGTRHVRAVRALGSR